MKKGQRIAYLIALAVIVVLLVIAATSGNDLYGTLWSLMPPFVAIGLALISKETFSSLFLGCFVGALLFSNFNIWNTVCNLIGPDVGITAQLCDAWNMGILVFLVLLGILVSLVNRGGGSAAFGRWAKKNIKTRCGAQLITMLLGVIIFIDDYFNCLTVGSVMRPVTESHKISRAKLAYLIDATAAPVCMLVPVSSWGAAVSGYVTDNVLEAGHTGIELFLSQIPYNYYCLGTLFMIIVISVLNIDYGPMFEHEYNAQVKNDLFTTPERPYEGADDYEEGASKSSVLDLIVPIIVLIISCVFSMVYTGGFFEGVDFLTAFADCDAAYGLTIGGLISLVVTFAWFWVRGGIDFVDSFHSIPKGLQQMAEPILILTFAWTLKSFTDGMGSSDFVNALLANADTLQKFLPAIIFVLACVIAFATGTSWGTIGIMVPIVCSAFDPVNQWTLLQIGLAASCAGGVCGDHCSPISDTTIMASTGAHCFHLNHVTTQMTYAVTVIAVSFVSFIIAGFVQNAAICLIINFALVLAVLLVIKSIVNRKYADKIAEIKAANAK
ncbi:MAG: Na+/H+ antiporter NhaC family protein [Clostridia bacterium]|nr:Na+/H+ antiporter NhaC family protein [Clostridia bacterium]